MDKRLRFVLFSLFFSALWCSAEVDAQERVKIAYSSADASNAVWFLALDAGLYRKHGLDVELVFIQSSTTSVSSVVATFKWRTPQAVRSQAPLSAAPI
ncbi:MAG TPA: hypothetical protein VGW77_00260 [Candidatus Binatia bacterium]|jgi:ABC-type nitrate/sulfonate/bicarbonate transport system substrate-binding protein|nr:hypothetical protein [Candidatus Binatia bacterium]